MVSIKDVARVAGVSDKTVSRVVNGEPNVTADTIEKVQLAIAGLGYIPNLAARSIRSNRTDIIGIITDFISTTPYSGDIVRGVQDWAGANGRTVLLANTDGDQDREANVWRTFKAHRIDGVLYVAMYHRVVVPAAGEVSIPTVLVNSHAEDGYSYPSIEPDDYGGAYDLTRHLIDLGHRRIGYIRLNPLLLGANQRLDAFLAAAQAHGLSENDMIIRLGMEGPIGRETNYVYREALDILSLPDRPTALVCGNDEMALQAYLAALSLGLRIPDDITIVGFDDFRTVSLGLKPELTTVALPYYDLGWQGADMLDQLIQGKGGSETERRVLRCSLVTRRSSTRVC
ncbi:LacI family DNA-binding transcriptional regulator [Mesorhizobium sp. BR1-1-16]|uniref:LacI family DNA-binding transcriptional regulator n=1 Tax=Mesorhizobium sp. BR1-1-16 TaxID=2876653 RepID=UPI001CCA43C0|nr:LacI family DNA-binding transcriptional regulator [Mesorhizobium sp. BR1-1-16]MBZ9939241.1 LacI family DNA-binding transcriptional regulator [Mesorhizobium sp. BR1-1-16]